MFAEEYKGINTFLIGASRLLLKHGVERETRGYKCKELPGPIMFKINDPQARFVTIKERKWNPILPFAESLWLASGRNDMAMMGHYLEKLKDFADDGEFMRGGYGPRIRNYNGNPIDYKVNEEYERDEVPNIQILDQFRFLVETFKKDINSRQAIITIGDPPKDCFVQEGNKLKTTKDFPCTRLLHFQKQACSNKLDLTVYMRSNDLLWGASAVNIFNFTFIQEYIAHIIGLEIGDYFHIVNNFHYYLEFEDQVKAISESKERTEYPFIYEKGFDSLETFDEHLTSFQKEEIKLRQGNAKDQFNFKDSWFNDWYKAIYCFNTKNTVEFANPIMNILFKKYMTHG